MRPIFCVSGNDWLEKHAAEEFAKYVKAMTGAKPAIVPSPASLPKKGVVVSVGKTSVSDSLFKKRLAKVAGEAGEEGFLIKSADGSGGKCLLLLGGSPRGTLYAVYHYLEKFCGVGFFWDGERIPKLEEIPVDGIDVFERPYFPIREYMMDCEYTSYWWGWKEWKREVDWAAKHRFNVLSSNFDFTATWRRVWKKFGVEVPPTSLTAPPFHPWAGWHKWDIKPPYPESFQDFIAA
ncbi:MAG: hypothetical protein JTT11_04005, partial [Candidatus Brockarchaeota archaeon]|nr:hypothetical protein [Candidatus Brockarchaeota archaeon]